MMTDPIADLLTRIRNANRARKDSTDVPWSQLKEAIARVLVAEGILRDVMVSDSDGRKVMRVSRSVRSLPPPGALRHPTGESSEPTRVRRRAKHSDDP